MSFLIYFFVLLVSAASVLFGLDLMSAPLPNTPNVPIGRSVQVVSPPPGQRETRAADERALTPVYPTEPGRPKIQAETSGAAPQEHPQEQQQATLTAPPVQPATPAPVATPAPAATVAQAPQPAPGGKTEPVTSVQPTQAPVVEAKTESTVATQPVTQQTASSCNVRACGAAYQSFRASDCSYQPTAGPRRACAISGAGTAASRGPRSQTVARQSTGKDEMREVERIVKRQPLQLAPSARQARGQTAGNGEMSEVERIVRHMTRNESGDIPVQAADGSIIIVRKTYR
jgi:hypothetical protein